MPIIEPWPQLQNYSPFGPPLNLNAGGPLICSAGRASYLRPRDEFDWEPGFHFAPMPSIEMHRGPSADCQTCGYLYR